MTEEVMIEGVRVWIDLRKIGKSTSWDWSYRCSNGIANSNTGETAPSAEIAMIHAQQAAARALREAAKKG